MKVYQLNNENMAVIPDVYVDYHIGTGEIFLKHALNGERKEKIDINKILDIKFSYK